MSLSARYIAAIVALVIGACVLVSGAVLASQLASAGVILQENGELTAALLAELAEDGPDQALKRAVGADGTGVYAAALYDANFNVIASASDPSSQASLPTADELRALANVSEESGEPEAVITGRTLIALTSVDLPTIKWAVVILSTADAIDNLAETVRYGIYVTLVLALIAAIVGALIARRITKPLQTMGKATTDLESGTFDAASLQKLSKRKDDIGGLARRFTEMASEVQDREHRLAAEVEALQVQINQADRQRSVDTITNSASFADLEQRAARLRARRAKQEKQ